MGFNLAFEGAIPFIVTKPPIYQTNTITSNIHNRISFLLLHVSADLCHLQEIGTPTFKTPLN